MICANEKCPSGVRTPAGCPALGSCTASMPVKTMADSLRDPEQLAELLCMAWDGCTPWCAWACRVCEANGRPECEDDPGGCRWNGKEKELILNWLRSPSDKIER